MSTTVANTSLRVSELDFDSIRNNLKNYLRNQSQFNTYDFEGSGMAVLLDILSYNTHYMAMQLNLVGNEMFLDTAQLRSSIISQSKVLNYVPTSRRAAEALVNIKVTPGIAEDNTVTQLTLSKYTRFLSSPKDGKAFNFHNMTSNTTTVTANGTFEWSNVTIKQGEVITNSYLVDQNNPQRRFLLPTANVDTSTISVLVQESEANNSTIAFSLSNDLNEVTSNSTVYWIEENSDANGTYSIYFGDGVLGKFLQNNNIVLINYLDTQAQDANKVSTFMAADGIGGYDANVIVSTVTSSLGGAEKESIEEIRFQAPIHYTAQNRAVTIIDYESLLLKDYQNIEAVSVWSGDDNIPPVYGKVFISLKPIENYEITTLEKERIKAEIIANRSVLTVFPEIVDPDYTYFLVNVTVNYDPDITVNDEDEIKSLVRAAIIDYKDNELKGFNSTFRKSRLQRYIESAHEAIISSSVAIYAQKRFEPVLETSKNYTINFNIPLYKSGSIDGLFSYPEVIVLDGNNIERSILIEEIPNSFTGIDSVDVDTPGQDYTELPTITISGDGAGANAVATLINGKVQSITVIDRGSNYTRATVAITGGEGNGATATAVLEAKNGVLRTFYYKENGEKVIVNNNAGTIDYNTGILTLSGFLPLELTENQFYDNTVLTLNIQPLEDTIVTQRNQILDIDEDDNKSILIKMVAE